MFFIALVAAISVYAVFVYPIRRQHLAEWYKAGWWYVTAIVAYMLPVAAVFLLRLHGGKRYFFGFICYGAIYFLNCASLSAKSRRG